MSLINREALMEEMFNHYQVRNPGQNANSDDFCSYGERKEGAD